MVKILHPKSITQSYYMDPNLYANLKLLPARIEEDKDVLGIIVGSPGEGKSTLAQQILYTLDTRINVKTIMYSMEDYVKYCINLFQAGKSKGRGVMHDEGREVLSGGAVLTRRTRSFMNFLYENRQMNMYQLILTGDFFDLPRAIIRQRCLFMIWVHEYGEFKNGLFKFYNAKTLRTLYYKGKRQYLDMAAVPPNFSGKFPRFYTVDDDEYRKVKKEHLTADRYLDFDKKKGEQEVKDEEVIFNLPKLTK